MANSNDELDQYIIQQNAERDDEQELGRLARLSAVKYEREREAAAEKLGMRVSALDSAVAAERTQIAGDQTAFLGHWNIQPWPEPVDGATLLKELRSHFVRYAVVPQHADKAIALWILHTYVFDEFDITPYLAVTSPTRRCGKSLVLTLLYWLCQRAKKNDSMSKAAIFRSVERDKPTLCLDEVSWVVDNKDERQNILCGGFERNGYAEVCEGEGANITPKLYSTFCPRAFGLIGKLVPVLMDRSIEIQMQRKLGEKVERLRRSDNDQHREFREKCVRWANDNRVRLSVIRPALPSGLNDRAFDIWEPLLAIAQHVGGGWLEISNEAAVTLSAGETVTEERGVTLLADLNRSVFIKGRDEIATRTLIEELCADSERPWATWNKGKPISDRQIAKLLKPFGIISGDVHPPGEKHAKGYKKVHCLEAFERYLTPLGPPTTPSPPPEGGQNGTNRANADEVGTTPTFSSVRENNLHGNEECKKSASHAGLRACTARTANKGGNGGIYLNGQCCAQCSQPGELLETYCGSDVPVWLHRDCQDAYLAVQIPTSLWRAGETRQ